MEALWRHPGLAEALRGSRSGGAPVPLREFPGETVEMSWHTAFRLFLSLTGTVLPRGRVDGSLLRLTETHAKD
jgi:hypothetical protein